MARLAKGALDDSVFTDDGATDEESDGPVTPVQRLMDAMQDTDEIVQSTSLPTLAWRCKHGTPSLLPSPTHSPRGAAPGDRPTPRKLSTSLPLSPTADTQFLRPRQASHPDFPRSPTLDVTLAVLSSRGPPAAPTPRGVSPVQLPGVTPRGNVVLLRAPHVRTRGA
jgi:hypothetical protein